MIYEDPEDRDEKTEFKLQLKNIKSKHDPYVKSWNISRIKAFKRVTTGYILKNIVDSEVTYFEIEDKKTREYDLRITVNSKSLGQLSTEFPLGIILSSECPHNLPELIAQQFKEQLTKNK